MGRNLGALALALVAAATAASARGQTWDGDASRYGPAGASARPEAPALRPRLLNWPGKAEPQSPAYAPTAVSRYAAPALRGPEPAPADRATPRPLWAPALIAAAPRAPGEDAAGAGPALMGTPSRTLPQSIYDAPRDGSQAPLAPAGASPSPRAQVAAPAAPRASLAQEGRPGGVRFYSVHRPFGIQPDPPPIPPQFFAATADLSTPAGPGPGGLRRNGANAAAARNVSSEADSASAAQP